MESPLVEPLEDGRFRVTVAFRDDDADEVFVIGGLAGADPADRRMRLGADGWWRRSYEIAEPARLSYWFTRELIPGELLVDPLNPTRHVYAPDPDVPGDVESAVSIVELPGAPEARWTVPRDVPQGTVQCDPVRSRLLANERRVFTYRPPGYDEAEPYPLILCFDGQAYTHDTYVRLPTVLDNLIADGAIPPVVAVLPASLDNETRHRELAMDEPFLDFLVAELIPWAHERLSFADDPARTLVAGASLGGLQAAFCGLNRSDVFGLVLSQSGSFQRGLPDAFAVAERLPLRFALDVGRFETTPFQQYSSLYHANLHMRDVLVAKGYDVTFREYPTGHDFFWWGETIADGLVSLLN